MNKNVIFAACLLSIISLALAENPYMGNYEGTVGGHSAKAYVIAVGGQNYRVNISSADGTLTPAGFDLSATEFNGVLCITGQAAGRDWNGKVQDGVMTLDGHYYGLTGELKKVQKESPTLGQKPPKDAVVLLPYEPGQKTSLEKWTNQNWQLNDDGSMEVKNGSNFTVQQFSNVQLHIEFCLPLEVWKIAQHRANSGVFFNESCYEVQVLDSFGLMIGNGDCGSIYSIKAPDVNASLAPEQWQTYDITFYAPVLDAKGKVATKPRITVIHNGVKIHDNVEIPHSTINPDFEQKASGPIQLQDHGSAVRYRNIWAVELK
jgi:hypothetical protein